MLRAVADTNVLVAAAITPHGVCGHLLDAAIARRWQPVASPRLLSELAVVLHRDKFRRWLTPAEARQFVSAARILADVVADPPAPGNRITADPKDEYLVVLAQAADVATLISGDPHLTELTDIQPPVMTPAAFLERIQT